MDDLHGDALKRIMGDMDDMEGKRMFPPSGNGATITISISPGLNDEEGASQDNTAFPEGHDEAMCKGGCAYHNGGMVKEDADTAEELPGTPKLAQGGMIPQATPQMGETDESGLPPFLRKKKGR